MDFRLSGVVLPEKCPWKIPAMDSNGRFAPIFESPPFPSNRRVDPPIYVYPLKIVRDTNDHIDHWRRTLYDLIKLCG
jgi:hypothetical protein